jgi:DNA-binding NtrC family response regulator
MSWLSENNSNELANGRKVVVFLDLWWGRQTELHEDTFLKTLLCRESHFSAQAEETRPNSMAIIKWLRKYHSNVCIVPVSTFGVGRMQSLCRYLGANFVIQKFPKLQDLYGEHECSHPKSGTQCERCLFALEALHRSNLNGYIETLVSILHKEGLFSYDENGKASCDLVAAMKKSNVCSHIKKVSNLLHLRDIEGQKVYDLDPLVLKHDIVRLAQELMSRRDEEAISYLVSRQIEDRQSRLKSLAIGVRLEKIISQLCRIAPTNVAILLNGRTGVGKTHIAKAIHECSLRSTGPFVILDASKTDENLLGSELFGHEPGAFTDAKTQRIGYLEMADGGTLFIDELNSISMAHQQKLLRFLDGGGFERIGGSKTISPNVRIICAANEDLQECVKQGRFRQDLYYRVKSASVDIPGIAGHPEEIEHLAQLFLVELNAIHKCSKQFSDTTIRWMCEQQWEGNVRELKSAIGPAFYLADHIIEPEHFLANGSVATNPLVPVATIGQQLRKKDDILAEYTRSALDLAKQRGWTRAQLAAEMGIGSSETLGNWIKKYCGSDPYERNDRRRKKDGK